MRPLTPGSGEPERPRWRGTAPVILVAAAIFSGAVFLMLSAPGGVTDSTTTTTSLPVFVRDRAAIDTVEELIAAMNEAEDERVAGVLALPVFTMRWPGAFPFHTVSLATPGAVDFLGALGLEVEAQECDAGRPAPEERPTYDVTVRCDVSVHSDLQEALGAGSRTGVLYVDLWEGSIRNSRWSETRDTPAWEALEDLLSWMQDHRPYVHAHFLSEHFGDPLYGADAAGAILAAASDRARAVPGDGSERRPRVAHPRLAATADGVVLLGTTGGSTLPLLLPGGTIEIETWMLAPDDGWVPIPPPDGTYQAATLAGGVEDGVVFVGATAGDDPSLSIRELDSSTGTWPETARLGLDPANIGSVPATLSAAVDLTSGTAIVVSWPAGMWRYEAADDIWIDGPDPWDIPEREWPRPCRRDSLPVDISVSSDSGSRRFVVASGFEICLYDPLEGTIEVALRSPADHPLRSVTHDPADGRWYVIGGGRLWSYERNSDALVDEGTLPEGLLWRNAAMVADPDGDLLVFDGVRLWSHVPVTGSWTEVETP